jgi:putative SOS response-associated peptidase YedK
MCGRYNFTVEQSDEVIEILEQLNAKIHGKAVKTGEIYPTNLAPILVEEERKVSPVPAIWGYPKFNDKGVIINARVESAPEKKTFRDSLLNRRCIIPSTGFYEWDGSKRKYLFRLEDTTALYMAGLFTFYNEEMRYVILTTGANASIKDVHDRMPLVIPKDEIKTWIMDSKATNELLHRVPPQLVREAEDGQLSLF